MQRIDISGVYVPKTEMKQLSSNVISAKIPDAQPDTFEKKRPSLKDATEFFKKTCPSINFSYGVEEFQQLYKKNEIGLETLERFSDTSLDLKSMSAVHKLYNSSLKQGVDLSKNGGFERIHQQVEDIEYNNEVPVKAKFNGENLEMIDNQENEYQKYYFDKNGEMVGTKTVAKSIFNKFYEFFEKWSSKID